MMIISPNSARSRHWVGLLVGVVCLGSMLMLPSDEGLNWWIERRLSSAEHSIAPSIRLAVFGTSNAYGGSLQNRFSAYPYLLSEDVDVYSHFGNNNLNFFSNCLQSTIGNEKMYDVIILDYWIEFDQGLDMLVKRLRHRFPYSTLIILKTWNPSMFRRKGSTLSPISHSFDYWKQTTGMDDPVKSIEELLAALSADTGHWFLPHQQHANKAVEEISTKYGVLTFSLPLLPTGIETLMTYLAYFDSASNLNSIGHQALAKNLQSLITAYVPSPEALANSQVHGSFGYGDECNSWYWTGGTRMTYSHTLNMRQRNIHNDRVNYALEVNAPGWINVTNPYGTNRTLFLSFLVSLKLEQHPKESPDLYPKVSVRLDLNNSVSLDPSVYDVVTETRTVRIGDVTPGFHQVPIQAISGGQDAFGLVGSALLSGPHAKVSEYSFVPSVPTKAYIAELVNGGHNISIPSVVQSLEHSIEKSVTNLISNTLLHRTTTQTTEIAIEETTS